MLGLPKLRWLVVGAVAAGAWAMTQDPPGPPERRSAPRAEPAVVRAQPAARPSARPAPSLATGSIRRPERPLAAPHSLWTRERVRLRAEPSTEARVVVWLRAGERVAVSERSGVWHRVSAGGRKGWVHGSYLAAADPQPPRPKATVAAARPSMSVPVPSPAPPQPPQSAGAADGRSGEPTRPRRSRAALAVPSAGAGAAARRLPMPLRPDDERQGVRRPQRLCHARADQIELLSLSPGSDWGLKRGPSDAKSLRSRCLSPPNGLST